MLKKLFKKRRYWHYTTTEKYCKREYIFTSKDKIFPIARVKELITEECVIDNVIEIDKKNYEKLYANWSKFKTDNNGEKV